MSLFTLKLSGWQLERHSHPEFAADEIVLTGEVDGHRLMYSYVEAGHGDPELELDGKPVSGAAWDTLTQTLPSLRLADPTDVYVWLSELADRLMEEPDPHFGGTESIHSLEQHNFKEFRCWYRYGIAYVRMPDPAGGWRWEVMETTKEQDRIFGAKHRTVDVDPKED